MNTSDLRVKKTLRILREAMLGDLTLARQNNQKKPHNSGIFSVKFFGFLCCMCCMFMV